MWNDFKTFCKLEHTGSDPAGQGLLSPDTAGGPGSVSCSFHWYEVFQGSLSGGGGVFRLARIPLHSIRSASPNFSLRDRDKSSQNPTQKSSNFFFRIWNSWQANDLSPVDVCIFLAWWNTLPGESERNPIIFSRQAQILWRFLFPGRWGLTFYRLSCFFWRSFWRKKIARQSRPPLVEQARFDWRRVYRFGAEPISRAM